MSISGGDSAQQPEKVDQEATSKRDSVKVGEVFAASSGAREAAILEHSYSVREAFHLFRPAIGWCFLFSLGVVMAGFDPQLVGTLVAIPTFQKDFGVPFEGGWLVPAQWQSAFNLGVPIGQVIGAWGVGYPLEKIGRRWTLAICCVISTVVVAIQFSAQNKPQILVAELINGCVLGAFPVIAPT